MQHHPESNRGQRVGPLAKGPEPATSRGCGGGTGGEKRVGSSLLPHTLPPSSLRPSPPPRRPCPLPASCRRSINIIGPATEFGKRTKTLERGERGPQEVGKEERREDSGRRNEYEAEGRGRRNNRKGRRRRGASLLAIPENKNEFLQ